MKTIIDLFENSVKKYSSNVYLWQKENGSFIGYTYKETQERVYKLAAGLMHLGLKKGDRVSLLAEGRLLWAVSELAVLYNGAINVPLSVKLNEADEIIFRLNHSGSRFIIVSKNQLPKVEGILDKLDSIEKIIVLDSVENKNKNIVLVDDLIKDGELYLKKSSDKFDKRYKEIKDEDYANICYTSGTTADPKGIILSHRNYTANVEQASSLFDVPEWWTTLLILPWDHAFAHTVGIYILMKYGASLACVKIGSTPMETLKNIPINIKEIKPVFLLSVPALAKNFRKNIEKAIAEKGGLIEKMFNHALKIAYKYNGIGWDRGKGFNLTRKPLYKLYDAFLFKKIRKSFGGRLKFFVGGGALLDIELQRFFYAIGIPMYQGYGLSEAAPVICSNSPDKHKMGSSGHLVPNLDLKICDDEAKELPQGEKGEIVVRGENVMKGYWNNKEATEETIKDGWLYTGDMGYLDPDGFLYVLGRFKSLLIADDGEKYSPEGIEEAFSDQSKLIDQALLYNNQKPFTVCLISPNTEALKRIVRENNINTSTHEGLTFVLDFILNEINEYKKGGIYEDMFPQRWLPAAIGILPEGFTEENRMLNSTMKVVRPKVYEKYQQLINYLYTPEAKNISNDRNIEVIKQLLGINNS